MSASIAARRFASRQGAAVLAANNLGAAVSTPVSTPTPRALALARGRRARR